MDSISSLIAVLSIAAVFAGLFWNSGKTLHEVISHFVAPPLFAVATVFAFSSESRSRQLLILLLILSIAECARLVTYCVVANGWRYISADGETQMVLCLSFFVQCLIALSAWGLLVLVQRFV